MLGRMNRTGPAARARVALAAAACALAATAAAGCGDDDGAQATTPATTAATTAGTATATAPAPTAGTAPAPPATAPAPPAATAPVRLWFADADGALRAETREAPSTGDPLADAMAALAEGPDDPALLPALPEGTTVLGTSVAGDEARVDLSGEFERGYPQGSAAELATVGPIVRTAAEASGAARVRILVEGRVPAPTGTNFDFSRPFAPGDLPATGDHQPEP
ncbi:GerMN domain-containing protein [Miltoncostaea marina]|uniref:GerMN domain-containing protein n=1 Tax=Miltoncostaea marina TaxID=2843215 RepID=UPI001C3D03E1|nr:GerMN domain-containing protein [Miltoncostaea marina]